jgi:hypothetical protein
MLGRQDSQPVFVAAKLLILLAQKSLLAPQSYSELAQFFKAFLTRFPRVCSSQEKASDLPLAPSDALSFMPPAGE